MENQPLFDGLVVVGGANDDPGQGPYTRRNGRNGHPPPGRQYMEVPFPGTLEEQGPALLPEYLHIVQRRKGTLILIVLLGLLTSLLLTLPQTPIYQARASIEIQNLNENFLNMRNVSPTASDDGSSYAPGSDLQTQAKILQSDSLLERVAEKLDLGNKLFPQEGGGQISAWRKALGLGKGKQASTREKSLTLAAKNLKISTEPNTRLIEIRYDSTNPQLAADFVNTLTSEFVQQNIESHWKTTQQTGEWLTHQMEDIRIKLEKSEDQLQSYAQASGLLFTSEKDNVAEDRLRQLQDGLSKAQTDRVAKQSKYELVSTASPESLPEVLDDGTLKEYQGKITDLRRQLAEVSSSLTAAHPAVKKIQAQVVALELARDKERTNVVQRIRNEFESARRSEQLLAANYAAQARLMSEQAAEVTHYNILKHEVDIDRQLYDSMLQNVQQANMTSALRASNIRVVDSAEAPTRPYKPSIVLNSALGLLTGAFFGIALVVLQDRADRTINGPGDSTVYLDVPELGAIPCEKAGRNPLLAYYQNGRDLEGKKSGNHSPSPVELITSSKTPSFVADAFRATLTSILFSGMNGDRPRIIVITSANPGEGKTTIASNLALALAEIGHPVLMQSVLLIDGDLRRPRLHEIFGVPNRWGLTNLLEGKTPPNDCEEMVFKTGFRNLCLLPSGSMSLNIAGLLHSPRMLELLRRMRTEFHTVFIDTPPMLHMPDARVFGRVADGAILVVRSAQTMRDAALAATQRLTDDGTQVLGTILNQWDPRETNQYGYGYGYKHYY
ncbi:MAG: polysaccharide biosynthesis tyrosine autokinase [Candidatus Acidiferrales bacterium]